MNNQQYKRENLIETLQTLSKTCSLSLFTVNQCIEGIKQIQEVTKQFNIDDYDKLTKEENSIMSDCEDKIQVLLDTLDEINKVLD